jgi:hypothetical protein
MTTYSHFAKIALALSIFYVTNITLLLGTLLTVKPRSIGSCQHGFKIGAVSLSALWRLA